VNEIHAGIALSNSYVINPLGLIRSSFTQMKQNVFIILQILVGLMLVNEINLYY